MRGAIRIEHKLDSLVGRVGEILSIPKVANSGRGRGGREVGEAELQRGYTPYTVGFEMTDKRRVEHGAVGQ